MLILEFTLIKRILKSFLIPITLFLVQSCSQSQIGEELSNSFDVPTEEQNRDNLESKKINTVSTIQVNQNSKESPSVKKKLVNQKYKDAISSKNRFENQFRIEDKNSTFNPQPYRITIKLSAANPSAPAETVTKALRLAGVRFEVEMIELIEKQSSGKERLPGRSKR